MKLINSIERFSAHSLRVDLTSATAAGLFSGALASWINVSYRPFNLLAYGRFFILALGAYLVIALLLHRFPGASLKLILPSWIWIALLGHSL
jgi:hypothetical protein